MGAILDMITSGMILYYIPAALICIILHECAHGFIAYKLGDPTAKMMGRLTLNPIKHIEPIGLVTMVLFGFGWAKPVPVDLRYFKHPKRDMALVGAAGPITNFFIAIFFLLVAAALEAINLYGEVYNDFLQISYNFCYYTAILSIGLGIFNLIPFSPLDGSKILGALLPDKLYWALLRFERYGMILLVGLMLLGDFVPQLDFFSKILTPARGFVLDGLQWLTRLPFGLN